MRRALVIAAMLVWASTAALAFPNGQTGFSGKTGSLCSSCHNGGKAPASVTINGPATLKAGETEAYSVVVVSGASAKSVGFDVASSAGTLAPAAGGAADRGFNGDVTHSAPAMVTGGGTVTFFFTLTAPATAGKVTLFTDALSADGDGTEAGDADKAATFDITVSAPPPPPDMAVPPPPPDLAMPDLAMPDLARPDLIPPPDFTPPIDFAGLDLLGIDFKPPPPPPDLATPDLVPPPPPDLFVPPPPPDESVSVDAVTSASADLTILAAPPDIITGASPDFTVAKTTPAPEPRWSCGCAVGARPSTSGPLALAALVLLGLCVVRRRRR